MNSIKISVGKKKHDRKKDYFIVQYFCKENLTTSSKKSLR